MTRPTAERLKGLVQSDIRRMTRECQRVGGLNLGQGICDTPVPEVVIERTVDAIRGATNTYSYPEGTPEIRRAIADKLQRHNGIDADPDSQIVVTVGSSGAFTSAIMGLLDPGDGILLPEPYYGYHLNAAVVAGLEPQFLTLAPPEFSLTEEALEGAVAPNTRALMVCTPSNPSGKMFTRPELEAVSRVAQKHDLLVLTDEIYEYFRYDDRPHISPATIAGLADRTVTIMGLSKTFSITGWRLGYAVAPPEMARAMTLTNDLFYVCAATPLQQGVIAGFEQPDSYFQDLADTYANKRDMICSALSDAGLRPIVPQGAYYVLADIGHLGYDTALEGAMALLEETKVASVPGSAFYRGDTGERLLRFCYAKEDNVLKDACARLREFRGAP